MNYELRVGWRESNHPLSPPSLASSAREYLRCPANILTTIGRRPPKNPRRGPPPSLASRACVYLRRPANILITIGRRTPKNPRKIPEKSPKRSGQAGQAGQVGASWKNRSGELGTRHEPRQWYSAHDVLSSKNRSFTNKHPVC